MDWELTARHLWESPGPVGIATTAGIAAEHPTWHPNDVSSKVEALNACRPDVVTKTVADAAPGDLWGAMLRAELPGLVIAADPEMGSLIAEEQEGQAAGSLRVVRVPGAGHSVHRDAPEEFLTLVAEFATGS